MEFITANSQIIALLVVILLFFIYELYVKSQPEEEITAFIEVEDTQEESSLSSVSLDKSLDKEILEAVKIAVKIHKERSNE